MADVEKIQFWCQKVLPLVYDESLSYYEAICKINEKLNEVIENLNSFTDDYKKYTDAEVAALDQKLTALIEANKAEMLNDMATLKLYVETELKKTMDDVDKAIADVINQLNATTEYVDAQLTQQRNWVTTQLIQLKTEIQHSIDSIYDYVDANDKLIYLYVDRAVQKVIDMIPEITSVIVTNPITGKQEPIQDTLDYFAQVFKVNSFTAQEYDSQLFTAFEYDGYHITAFQFDFQGLDLLGKNKKWFMFNPMTGTYDFYQKVIYDLADMHKKRLVTALEFDNYGFTASELDGREITAYEYDWNGWNWLNATIPASQFDSLELMAREYDAFAITAHDFDYFFRVIMSEKTKLCYYLD